VAEVGANLPEGGVDDSGVSIHVVGAEDGHEYIRSDLLEARLGELEALVARVRTARGRS
jgi:hypothetical protein